MQALGWHVLTASSASAPPRSVLGAEANPVMDSVSSVVVDIVVGRAARRACGAHTQAVSHHASRGTSKGHVIKKRRVRVKTAHLQPSRHGLLRLL